MSIQVMINSENRHTKRQIVIADLVKQNNKTLLCRLADGEVIKRKIKRDIEPI